MATKREDDDPGQASCRQCVNFHEKTETLDPQAWGECWAAPPVLVDTEDGVGPRINWLYLPYVCTRDFKPRLQ